jgi:REP element-mobilizing transposase RayT
MTALTAMVRNHSVSTLVVHVVWATAGRVSVLPLSADDWLARELSRKCTALGAVMLAVGNAADHVHIVVQHSPQMALAALVGGLKGASSRAAHVSGVMGYDCGWQVGYWAESVGSAQIEPLLDYAPLSGLTTRSIRRSSLGSATAGSPAWRAWRPARPSQTSLRGRLAASK